MATTHDKLRSAARKDLGSDFAKKASPELLEVLAAANRGATRGLPHLERGGAGAPMAEHGFAVIELDKEQRTRTKRDPSKSRIDTPGERPQRIIEMREEFEQEAAEMPGLRQPTLCWLNRTIRVPLDPAMLADIATRGGVTKMDVPRRIVREAAAKAAAQFVGVPVKADAFRKKNKVTGKGIRVAVLDGEVAKLPDIFQDRVAQKRNYTDEKWGSPDWHGTPVAGIIGADSPKLVGIAPDAAIWSYKIFRTDGVATDTFSGALAIQNALEDGADVANCSWGAGAVDDELSPEAVACNTAWSLGLVIIKSSGNDGPNALTRPAEATGVIVVGGTSFDGASVWSGSAWGKLKAGGTRPHFCCPGGDDLKGIISCDDKGVIRDIGKGTSYAAPHATGVAALILQKTPNALPDDVRKQMIAFGSKIKGAAAAAQGKGLLVLG